MRRRESARDIEGTYAVEGPGVLGQELALLFQARVDGPELGAEQQSTIRLDAAGVDLAWHGLRRAGLHQRIDGMIGCEDARVRADGASAGGRRIKTY